MEVQTEAQDPVAQQGQPAPTSAKPSNTANVWTIVVCAAMCAATYFLATRATSEQIDTALTDRPDIAIVDDVALVRLAIGNGADRYKPKEVLEEIERMVKSAGMSNSVLLSQSMVLYSPPHIRVDTAPPDEKPRREIGP